MSDGKEAQGGQFNPLFGGMIAELERSRVKRRLKAAFQRRPAPKDDTHRPATKVKKDTRMNTPQQALENAASADPVAAAELERMKSELRQAYADRAQFHGVRTAANLHGVLRALLQSPVAGLDGYTIDKALGADWAAVHRSLVQARDHLQKGGVSHTWLDGAIGIAASRQKVPVPHAYLPRAADSVAETASAGSEAERPRGG